MSFEEEFPSLRIYHVRFVDDDGNTKDDPVINAVDTVQIEKCCVDKQRLREAISKCSANNESSMIEKDDFLEELGL